MKYVAYVLGLLCVISVSAQEARPDWGKELSARIERGDLGDFEAASERFIEAARSGKRELIVEALSPTTIKESKGGALEEFLGNVVMYFGDFERPVLCNGMVTVKDEYGNPGYIFHKAFFTKLGERRLYRMALLRESGKVYVSNVAPARTEYHRPCYN